MYVEFTVCQFGNLSYADMTHSTIDNKLTTKVLFIG